MVDLEKLKSTVSNSGIKLGIIAEKINISRYALHMKMTGKTQFNAAEISALSSVLHLDKQSRDDIFFAERVETHSTQDG